MDANASFGNWLTRRRAALGLSRAELARRVSCATITLRKIEEDARRPSPELAACLARQLAIPAADCTTFVRVARGELRVAWLAPAEDPASAIAPAAPSSGPGNLPHPLTPLIGRESHVAAACVLLRRSDVRLLTLTGPPGIGKTRLSLQVAAELRDAFADGVYIVPLAPLRDPAQVLLAIAQALGVVDGPSIALRDRLSAALCDRQLLLVLDNVEHLLAAAPELAALLATCPGLTVLATSRAPLHVRGEQQFPVPPLQLPLVDQDAASMARCASVELFVQRAQAVAPAFALSALNARAVAAICHRLDGLPLAIELAAARIKLFPPEALLTRLEERLALLTGGAADLPTRQQTLRGAIAWSYQLLSGPEQALFRRLGVFVGGCALEAVERICALPGEGVGIIIDGVSALVDQSLLQRNDGPDGLPRFTMLETIREYALEQLMEAGELERAYERHLAYYLERAEAAEPQLQGAEQQTWLDRLEQDHGNLRAALTWAVDHDAVGALRLGGALTDFWHMRSHLSEGRHWLERVLTVADAQANGNAAIGESPGSAPSIATRAKALHGAGTLAHSQEDDVRAEALYAASLTLAQAYGDQRRVALLLNDLGEMALLRGDTQRAMTLHQEALALARRLGDKRVIAQLLNGIGTVARTAEDLEAATIYTEESLELFQGLDDRRGVAWALHSLGLVAQASGAYDRASELFTKALALARAVGDRENMVWLLYAFGCMMLKHHDLAGATTRFGESARLSHDLGLRHGMALNLDRLATVQIQQRVPAQAARLLSVADMHWKQATSSYEGAAERAEHEQAVAVVRAQLDAAEFVTAWQAGQTLTLHQAVAEVLDSDITDPNHA
ncbi:MAG TPA: tetratricopeptide repeat protein [Roseiflexaceae bacterium]|nr:tetratricopeptide repeat protein [Roseiflexaceae bacterium]